MNANYEWVCLKENKSRKTNKSHCVQFRWMIMFISFVLLFFVCIFQSRKEEAKIWQTNKYLKQNESQGKFSALHFTVHRFAHIFFGLIKYSRGWWNFFSPFVSIFRRILKRSDIFLLFTWVFRKTNVSTHIY